jgi:hypothetical protein
MRWSILLVCAVLLAGCSAEENPLRPPAEPPAGAPRASAKAKAKAKAPSVRHAHCVPDAGDCAAVTGRVLYVEAVDPDGDGDAHYVLAGGDVTAPGLSAIDISREMRPRRLPRVGELVSAAGPVHTGSHGQHQIEAVTVNYQRPR